MATYPTNPTPAPGPGNDLRWRDLQPSQYRTAPTPTDMAGGSAMGGDVPTTEPGGFASRGWAGRPMAPRALHGAGLGQDLTHRYMQEARQGRLDFTPGGEGVGATGPGGYRYGLGDDSAASDALRQVQDRFAPVREARDALTQARENMRSDSALTPEGNAAATEARQNARQSLIQARGAARGGGIGGGPGMAPRMQSYRSQGRR